MLQNEFIKRVKNENVKLDVLNIIIGRKSNVPDSLGCYEENNTWKIYEVGERQNFDIIASGSEDEIFEEMYSLIKGKIKIMQRIDNMS